jgi:sulfoxide reductase heme-binding subunit YedZ
MALTVCFGILTTTGWARRHITRAALTSVHMVLAVSTLTFGVLHALSYLLQTGEHFTAVNAVIPFVAGGEFEVGLGIVGLELAVAVAISIMVQRRLGYRRWHVLHYLAYAAFALSLAHTVATSAEVQSLGLVGIGVFGCAAACVLLWVLRILPATTAVGLRVAPKEA